MAPHPKKKNEDKKRKTELINFKRNATYVGHVASNSNGQF